MTKNVYVTDIMVCEICQASMPWIDFSKHLDGHSDAEWRQWPGGSDALGLLLYRVALATVTEMRGKEKP